MNKYEHLLMIRMSGTISTKAEQTRQQFTAQIVRNIKDALKSANIPFLIQRTRIRLYVETPDLAAIPVLSRVFGIQAIARVQRRPFETLEDVVAAGFELYKDAVVGRTFGISPKRSGDRNKINFNSGKVSVALGQALKPLSAGVDLTHPDVWLHVELHPGRAFFYTDEVAGPAGLPLGVEGRALSLISGGFDSPVASWMMLNRGINLDYVFFNLGGTAHRRDVLQVLDVLAGRWSAGGRPRLYEVDLRPMIEHFRQCVPERFWQVILKRLMMRGATRIADKMGHLALVTGEAVGQVSSQTLHNLVTIDRATEALIMRPLIASHKDDIVEFSKRVGTHDISAGAQEYCALTPNKPATRMTPAQAVEAEADIDFTLLDAAVDAAIIYNLRDLDPEKLDLDTPSLDHIPEGAALVDLRDQRAFANWHWPGAAHMDYFDALKNWRELDKKRTWVLVCEVGLKSAGLAEAMRRAGYDAYSFKGGAPRLIKRAAELTDPLLADLFSPVALD